MSVHVLSIVRDRLAVELFSLVDVLLVLLRLAQLVVTCREIVVRVGVFRIAIEYLLEGINCLGVLTLFKRGFSGNVLALCGGMATDVGNDQQHQCESDGETLAAD